MASLDKPSGGGVTATRGRKRGHTLPLRRGPILRELSPADLIILPLFGLLLTGILLYTALLPQQDLSLTPEFQPGGTSLVGFHPLERNATGPFRWSKPEAALTFHFAAPGAYRIALTMQDVPAPGPHRSVTVYADGTPLGTVTLDGTRREYAFGYTLAPHRWADQNRNPIAIELQIPPHTAPGDGRALGVIFAGATLTPERALNPWQPTLLLPPLLLLGGVYVALRRLHLRWDLTAGVIGAALAALTALAIAARAPTLLAAWRLAGQPVRILAVALVLAAVPWIARRWPAAPDGQRRVILAFLLLLCYGFLDQPPGWNEQSRYDLVRAIVNDGTTRIDPYHQNTGDKAFRDGHYYSDKAPGSAFLAVPFYAVIRAVHALPWGYETTAGGELLAITFVVAVIPTVVLALLLLSFLRAYVGEAWALVVTLGYALGTIALPFATVNFGHAASACLLFAAFYVLWRARQAAAPRWALAAGFLGGWAVLVELPAALGVALVCLYALARDRRAALLFCLGGVPPAVLLLVYNWVSFGGPFDLGYSYVAQEYFAANMRRGLFGITLPRPAVARELLFGPRGLLTHAPWLAFAAVGLWAGVRRGPRIESVLCGTMALVFLVYNAGYFLPFGGWTPGPRFLMPALPFIAALVAFVPRPIRPLVLPPLVYAIAVYLIATVTGPNVPDDIRTPLPDYWWPRLRAGSFVGTTLTRFWSIAPAQALLLLGVAAVVSALAFYATTATTRARRLAAWGAGALATLALLATAPLNVL